VGFVRVASNRDVRVVYAQDGSVQSADVLTTEFHDTVTGSCVPDDK